MRSSRPTLLASVLLACGLGCSPRVQTGALKVEVVYDSNVVSRCVKVVATDDVGSTPLETMPISLVNQTSPLLVGVGGSSPLAQPFRVQALGYSDVGCTTRSNEESTAEPGVFAVPPQTVTLVLKVQPQNDGGTGGGDGGASDAGAGDGGTPDAGSDAGVVDAGGVDAGVVDAGVVDAGLDLDLDGVPQPADCNDNNPQIRPGIPEVCDNNNVDDNCNGMADCAETSCNGAACTNSGTCMSGMCMTPIEVCNDRVDNNNNGLTDCEESTCATQACNDANACTLNETCNGPDAGPDGGCSGAPVQCTTPPVCYGMTGACMADGTCAYTPLNSGPCNDGLACTDTDSCVTGVCTGTPRVCTTNNACLTGGTCVEDAGTCSFTPVASGMGTCTDGDNCTTNDACDGDGGCAGTRVNCAEPSQCHRWDNTCQGNGTCNFLPRATCDAGTATPGSCNASFMCVPPVTNIFPYTPSTFTEAQLPAAAANGFTISCNTVINTGGTTPAVVDGGCVTMPPFAILPATAGGQETLLLKVSSLTVNSSQTLTFIGPRPVVFAVLGNATVDGTILANSGPAPDSLCGVGGTATTKAGAGGAGFGRDGGTGGTSDNGAPGQGGIQNGSITMDPLRGGCTGGASSSATGGRGGGALQISAVGSVNVAGTLSAPGFGGGGGTSRNGGGAGGGSGGAILIEAAMLTTTSSAIFTANGGGGGGGEDSGNGVVGNPGSIGTNVPASGGNGPNNAGNGGNGGSSTANATNGQNSTDADGAGGGGGAVGRIRLRGTSCTVDGATLFSPPRGVGGNGC
jgi:hypothetical protein